MVAGEGHEDPDLQLEFRLVRRRVESLWKWAYGNGDVGAAEAMRALKKQASELEARVDRLITIEESRHQQERALRNQIRGATAVLSVLLTALGALIQFNL